MNAIGIKNTKSTRVGDDLTGHEGQRRERESKIILKFIIQLCWVNTTNNDGKGIGAFTFLSYNSGYV